MDLGVSPLTDGDIPAGLDWNPGCTGSVLRPTCVPQPGVTNPNQRVRGGRHLLLGVPCPSLAASSLSLLPLRSPVIPNSQPSPESPPGCAVLQVPQRLFPEPAAAVAWPLGLSLEQSRPLPVSTSHPLLTPQLPPPLELWWPLPAAHSPIWGPPVLASGPVPVLRNHVWQPYTP